MSRWLLPRNRNWWTLLSGLRTFFQSGETPPDAYQSLISVYCRTRGWSSDLLHWLVSKKHPPYQLPSADGVLGHLDSAKMNAIVGQLDQHGYCVFDARLPDSTIAELTQLAQRIPMITRPPQPNGERIVFDLQNPKGETYWGPEATLIADATIQRLMADHSLLAVAQAYLRCQPILDIVTQWWSVPYSAFASSESAQLYHFDMDRIKWLKFFFYLTDVTPETGPHCFVDGTHRRGTQPAELLNLGYARITDEQMAQHYPAERMLEVCGPKGTIVAVDTRGFHKGKPPTDGHRLLLQFEYSDCLFGGQFVPTPVADDLVPELEDLWDRHPRIFSKFVRAASL